MYLFETLLQIVYAVIIITAATIIITITDVDSVIIMSVDATTMINWEIVIKLFNFIIFWEGCEI